MMRLGCDTEDGPGSDGSPRLPHLRYKQHGNTRDNREIEDGELEQEAGVMMVTSDQGGSGMAGCDG